MEKTKEIPALILFVFFIWKKHEVLCHSKKLNLGCVFDVVCIKKDSWSACDRFARPVYVDLQWYIWF